MNHAVEDMQENKTLLTKRKGHSLVVELILLHIDGFAFSLLSSLSKGEGIAKELLLMKSSASQLMWLHHCQKAALYFYSSKCRRAQVQSLAPQGQGLWTEGDVVKLPPLPRLWKGLLAV